MNPVEQVGIASAIRLPVWRDAIDVTVHAGDSGDHPLRLAAGPIDRHHRGKTRPLQSGHGVVTEGGVLPHAGAHARLREFQNGGRHPADEQRHGVLEHLPGHRVGRRQGRLPERKCKIHRELALRLEQLKGSCFQPVLKRLG